MLRSKRITKEDVMNNMSPIKWMTAEKIVRAVVEEKGGDPLLVVKTFKILRRLAYDCEIDMRVLEGCLPEYKLHKSGRGKKVPEHEIQVEGLIGLPSKA